MKIRYINNNKHGLIVSNVNTLQLFFFLIAIIGSTNATLGGLERFGFGGGGITENHQQPPISVRHLHRHFVKIQLNKGIRNDLSGIINGGGSDASYAAIIPQNIIIKEEHNAGEVDPQISVHQIPLSHIPIEQIPIPHHAVQQISVPHNALQQIPVSHIPTEQKVVKVIHERGNAFNGNGFVVTSGGHGGVSSGFGGGYKGPQIVKVIHGNAIGGNGGEFVGGSSEHEGSFSGFGGGNGGPQIVKVIHEQKNGGFDGFKFNAGGGSFNGNGGRQTVRVIHEHGSDSFSGRENANTGGNFGKNEKEQIIRIIHEEGPKRSSSTSNRVSHGPEKVLNVIHQQNTHESAHSDSRYHSQSHRHSYH